MRARSSGAAALIRPLVWKLLYATGVALKKKKKEEEEGERKRKKKSVYKFLRILHINA